MRPEPLVLARLSNSSEDTIDPDITEPIVTPDPPETDQEYEPVSEWLDSGAVYIPEEEGIYYLEFEEVDDLPTPERIGLEYKHSEPRLFIVTYGQRGSLTPITEWKNSGDSIELPAGTYEIEFKSVERYATPSNIRVHYNSRGNLTRYGFYRDYRPGIGVFIDPHKARVEGAGWKFLDSSKTDEES